MVFVLRDESYTGIHNVMVAALSLAVSLAAGVPYLPQTEALCGGAAAAMVMRYWGDVHADPQTFGVLVDRRAGGIADRALIEAVRNRGWQAIQLADGFHELQERVAAGQP